MNPKHPQPQRNLELTEESLNKEFTIKFTRRELTVLFNLMMRQEFRLPDARLILGIVDKIESPVVALTNDDFKKVEEDKKDISLN